MESFPPLSTVEFALFRDLMHDSIGLNLPPTKMALVRGRLGKRLMIHSLTSYEDYFKYVTSAAGNREKVVMVDLLTTHETSFFRESRHFEYLAQEILEPRLAVRSAEPFRLWCAAVSSGEEAYTAAMVAHRSLRSPLFTILATDVSQPAVETARTGVYDIRRKKEIPQDFLKQYCMRGVRSMEGFFAISETLKERITFRQENLMELQTGESPFHCVFLRNVMIYFDQETKQNVIRNVMRRMEPGSYIFVGHSESLNGYNERLKWIRQGIYRLI